MTTATGTRVTARAPLRLDLAGGWSDVPPFSAREGGAVLSAAIDLTVRATAAWSERWQLVARELGADVTLADAATDASDHRVALHASTLRSLRPRQPMSLTTGSDVPPGSGLGSSGALGVALVHAVTSLLGEPLGPDAVAARAFEIETVGAGVPGGKQDQYSAAHGGFNLMQFRDPDVQVQRRTLEPAFLDALEASTVLCYTGASRLSGNTIARVMRAYEQGTPRVVGALRELRDLAFAMDEALQAGDLQRTATLMDRNWSAQQQLDPAMCTPEMARLEAAMRDAGALGGKAAGSGAGGCMFFIAPDSTRAVQAATVHGAVVLPVHWAPTGVHCA